MKISYPPRAVLKITPGKVARYDNGSYFAQAKFNGSHAVVTPEVIFNRYKKQVSWNIKPILDGFICGEYMNKGGLYEGLKFIIFDTMLIDNVSLIGTTYEYRYNLLMQKLSIKNEFEFAYDVGDGIGIVKNLENFESSYKEIVKHKILEGLVLKKKIGTLKYGSSESSNKGWMIKVRKPNKCYSF